MKERSQQLLSEALETADSTRLSHHIQELERLIKDYYRWVFQGLPQAVDHTAARLVLMMRTNQLIGPLPQLEEDTNHASHAP